MTLVPVPLRRRRPLSLPNPALPAQRQPSVAVPVELQTPSVSVITSSVAATPETLPTMPSDKPSSQIPPRWAVGLVALVLMLAATLIGLGHPVAIVLEVLAGAGYLGVEIVRQLNREL